MSVPTSTWRPEQDIEEILIDEEALARRVAELGEQITSDYQGQRLLLLGVLKGAVLFMVDLARQIQLPLEIDFMATSSYGASTKSSGIVRILKDLEDSVEGQHILVVEDIVDSGLTLDYLLRSLEARGPASVKVCGLLVKDRAREHRGPDRLRGIHDSGPLRGRVRPRLRRALSQPAVHRRAASRAVRDESSRPRTPSRYRDPRGMRQGFAIIVVQPPSDRGSPWWRGRQERSEA